MTFRKAFTVWILIVFAFLGAFNILHSWILLYAEGAGFMMGFPLLGNTVSLDVTFYLFGASIVTLMFMGVICYVVFHSDSLDLTLFQLAQSFEEKLDQKGEEMQASTTESLAKLGLREFQLKEDMKNLRKETAQLNNQLQKSIKNWGTNLDKTKKQLVLISRKTNDIQKDQKQLFKQKKKLTSTDSFEKKLKDIHEKIEEINSIPKPYLSSTDKIELLEGQILKKNTVQQLKSVGLEKIEDLLLKSPIEIVLTKVMSENEAKSLQSILQLLMVPGVEHEDAMLLLKSGVSSKQELGLQDSFSLGARISKTAEHYVKEGKIKENEKPTLEEIASWIKWAKIQ